MKIDLSQFRQTFLLESAEHVAVMEAGLLDLRDRPDDRELLNSIFRSAHSIKGGAGSFGLESLVHFTHALESLLDRMREGEIRVSDEVVSALLESIDTVRSLLEAESDIELDAAAVTLIERMVRLTQAEEDAQPEENAQPGESGARAMDARSEEAGDIALYRVEFKPDREIFSSGTNPIVLLRNLASLGQVSTSHLHTGDLPALGELDAEQCYLGWTVELATFRSEAELREVFEFVEHLAEISVRRIGDEPARKPDAGDAAARQAAKTEELVENEGGDEGREKGGEKGREKGGEKGREKGGEKVGPRAPAPSSITSQRSGSKAAPGKPAASGESSSIRVAIDKVDRLIDLVGELVIAHVMTAQMVETFTPECLPRLRQSVAAMERNTRELHERVMAVRMLPVGTLFQRYVRTVYDIAHSTGKQLRLTLAGEETEIDKGMLEMLGDPLTHLVRNAADHGIESPEARAAAGKPTEGAINLRAFHRSGRIVIEIADDGAGIDPARVRAKAIERGLIAVDAQLSDDQLRMLIFEPGFSTRDQVSDLSGRGVGLDVVQQNVRQLNGTVTVASEVGKGSTVTIELPLTLAILEGLLVRVADRTLVLPLLEVVETVSPKPSQIQRVAEQGEVVLIRDQTIPLLRVERFLGLMGGVANHVGETHAAGAASERSLSERSLSERTLPDRTLIVVVETGRRKIGLVVDELLGQQQVVVKSLERHLRKVEGLMGATILGDGCVAPIVDVAGLAALNLFSLPAARTNVAAAPETQFAKIIALGKG